MRRFAICASGVTARLLLLTAIGCAAVEAPAPDEPGEDHGDHDHSAAASLNPALAFSVDDLIDELNLMSQLTQVARAEGGMWSDCSTWRAAAGCPAQNAIVLIPSGSTVTIDGELSPTIRAVIVRGTLRFHPNRKTRLRVDTMLIADGGALEIGTPAAPIGVSARVTFPAAAPAFPAAADPRAGTHGLISEGRIVFTGQPKAAYAFSTRDALAGQRQLVFEAPPANWAVGDDVVIPATTFERTYLASQNEVRKITAIAPCATGDRTCVTLDAALQHDHRVPAVTTPAGVPAMRLPVANLARNVIVETEAAPDLPISRHGHVMLMSNDAKISGVLFARLGRTDKRVPIKDPVFDPSTGSITPGKNPRARYALHFHEAGSSQLHLSSPAVVEDSVVLDAPGWGFVNHSSTVHFQRNVAFDFVGAGFVTEDGDEAGEFVGNLAIGGRSTGSAPDVPGSDAALPRESMKWFREVFGNAARIPIGDMGFGGHGFWFQGADVAVVNNISAGHKGSGFVFWADGKYDPATGGYTSFPVDRLPPGWHGQTYDDAPDRANINNVAIRQFRNNVAFANFTGLKIRFTNGHGDVPLDATLAGEVTRHLVGAPQYETSTIEASTLWGNHIGLLASYTKMSFRDVFIVAPPKSRQEQTEWQPSSGLRVRGPHVLDFVSNVKIQGYTVGAFDDGCDTQGAGNTVIDASGLRIDGNPVDVTKLPPCGP